MLGIAAASRPQIKKYLNLQWGAQCLNAKQIAQNTITPFFSWPFNFNAANLASSFRIRQITVNNGPEGGASGYSYYMSEIMGGYSVYGGALTAFTLQTVAGSALSYSVNAGLIQVSLNCAAILVGGNTVQINVTPTMTGSNPSSTSYVRAHIQLLGMDDNVPLITAL